MRRFEARSATEETACCALPAARGGRVPQHPAVALAASIKDDAAQRHCTRLHTALHCLNDGHRALLSAAISG